MRISSIIVAVSLLTASPVPQPTFQRHPRPMVTQPAFTRHRAPVAPIIKQPFQLARTGGACQ